jgi:hypothetical protein
MFLLVSIAIVCNMMSNQPANVVLHNRINMTMQALIIVAIFVDYIFSNFDANE